MKNIEKNKKRGGRRKVDPTQLQNFQLKIFVTEFEFNLVNEEWESSGNPSRSDFLRSKILYPKRKVSSVNPKELLRHMDAIGTEIARIGNNMNQIAKYANSLALRGDIDTHPVKQFNKLMDEYLEDRRELVKAYRAVVKNF